MISIPLKSIYIAFPIFILLATSIPYNDVYRGVYFLILAPATIIILYRERRTFFQSSPKSVWLAALLLSYLFLSVAWSLNVNTHTGLRYFRWYLETLFFAACVYLLARDIDQRKIHFRSILHAIVLCVASVAIAKYIWGNLYPQRLTGPGFLAHTILGTSVLISLWVVGFLDTSPFTKKNAPITILTTATLVIYALLSQSRGPLLSIILLLTAYTAIYIREPKLLFSWLFVIFAVLALILTTLPVDEKFFHSLISRGDSYRITIWQHTLNEIWSQPIFGRGIATDLRNTEVGIKLLHDIHGFIDHPHNIILSVLYFGGFVGISLFFTFIALMIANIRRLDNSKHRMIRYTGILAVFMLFFTDGYRLISSPSPMWLIFWLPLCVIMAMDARNHSRDFHPNQTAHYP